MIYERPSIADRRYMAAQLIGVCVTSGGIPGLGLEWRRPRTAGKEEAVRYERPSIEDRRDMTAQLSQLVQTSGGPAGKNPTWRRPPEN